VPVSTRRESGALAIVLHTHMPYVEGFGTWPFGEEWLWEAMVGSYLPLLELLDAGAPLTLSLTPVLCDQLEAYGIAERFVRFVDEVRGETHRDDAAGMRAGGHEQLAIELERSYGDYTGARDALSGRGGDLLGALGRHAQWTSAATHAVLPLLAGEAVVDEQIASGIRSHARRFGPGWGGGFWLPECAHESWLERPLLEAGVRAVCIESTERFGLGAAEHLQPLRSRSSGLTLVPVDRQTMSLVWSRDGYPAAGPYRDYHHHTVHHHNPWSNDGGAYDHRLAAALAHEHARDFVARTAARLREQGTGLPGGGLVVCALDTELLGHWWYEGVTWLAGVVEECVRQGLGLVRLDDALADLEPREVDTDDWPASSWGQGGDLSTWSGPAVADIAFQQRAAELGVLAAGAQAGPAAVRALMALQASDWAFMVSRDMAVPYARERLAGHSAALDRALADGPRADAKGLRNLAVDAHAAGLLAPV
jgi:1,4-alpha-glucan branching enzyme